MRKSDEMCRWRYLHGLGKPGRHALERRIAAREHVHGQIDQHVEQAELRHRPRNCAQKDSDRGCEEQVDHHANHKQRYRAGDGNPKHQAQHQIKLKATATAITRPFAQTLDIAISNGVSGMTRR